MPKPKSLGTPDRLGSRGSKIGVYGDWGTGKTELVMSATKVAHLLVVDAEGRTQFYDPKANHGFEVIYSKDVKDALTLLEYAEELHAQGKPVIFAIDSFSSMWFEQQEVAEAVGVTSKGTVKFNAWGVAKKPLKRLYARLFSTPVDCIITMRAKPKYEVNGAGEPKDLGYDTADTERGLSYTVDLVVEMKKDQLSPGTPLKGDNFYAIVVKTSGPKETNPLPIGTRINDPSFEKLMKLRVKGTKGRKKEEKVEIVGVEAGLVAALEVITDSKSLGSWVINTLGMDKGEAFAILKEQHGPYDKTKLQAYIKTLWAISQGQKPELEKAA